MTTIAYKDGVLASDSRVSNGGFIFPGSYQKIFVLPDGSLFGAVGSVGPSRLMLSYLLGESTDLPTWGNKAGCTCIHVHPNGRVWTYEGDRVWLEQKGGLRRLGLRAGLRLRGHDAT